jgi:uncharacterized membrane protein YdbT with pleckstrin-like domain
MSDQTHNEKVWDKILSPNEEVKYEFSIGKQYIKTYLIIWAIISLPFVFAVVGVFMFALAFLYLKIYLPKANIYGFTNKRVLIHRGFFSTDLVSVDYNKITDVTVRVSFLDKTFTKSGQICINTAGGMGKEIILQHVANPYEIKKKLDGLRDEK